MGLVIPGDCALCLMAQESHDHIFFECEFSSQLWNSFASEFHLPQPLISDLAATAIASDPSLSRSSKGVIIRLLFQVIIYQIWKERNRRIFTSTSSTVASVRVEADRIIRDRLLSYPATSVSSASLLEVYFLCCNRAM